MSAPNTTPTLADVARAAGVSTATVSRCLNAPERVVEETRQRVLATVEALGYTPNFAARVMAAKRSFTVGAIIPTMDNAIFARCLQAVQEELHLRGYTLLVASSAYHPDAEAEQIRTLAARGADGLLLIGQDRDRAIYDYLDRQRLPALALWTHAPNTKIASVGFDNASAMQEITRKALDLGHRSFAMISGPCAGNDRAQHRVQGVRAALAAQGLTDDALRIYEGPYSVGHGADALRRIAALAERPTAVICGNDVLAAGAVRCAGMLGLRVPDDISITGFDDIELAQLVEPALTTVHVPHHEMGRAAAQEIVEMIEQKRPGRSIRLQTALQLRHSLGPRPTPA